MSFDTLGLSPALLRALADQGYTTPTPIQSQAIPLVLAGRDLVGCAQTGTGKTAGFALPILERLFPGGKRADGGRRRLRVLVLTPTRELAAQVQESFRDYGKHVGLVSTTVFGGVGMSPQVKALRQGVDVVVATPGRLMDHMQQRTVDLSGIDHLVLDEADRMLDMGFLPAIQRILQSLPKARQTLLFSATFADEIRALAARFMRDPAEVSVARRNSAAETVAHVVHPVDNERKRDLLLHLFSQDSRQQTLVFCRTKHGSDRLVKQLVAAGLKASAIHGNKSQGARTKALADFKNGRVTILVATDIAARGLDIEQLPAVINFDLPTVAEDYVHRIGRTGRAGHEGRAISLVSHEEGGLLADIQKVLKRDIEITEIEGFAPSRPLRLDSRMPKPGQRKQNAPRQQRPHAPRGGQPRTQAHAGSGRRDSGRSANRQRSQRG
jgi:ATP-dependent RNA helicase RhlE